MTIDLWFLVVGCGMTVVLGFILIPIIRKAMADDPNDSRGEE